MGVRPPRPRPPPWGSPPLPSKTQLGFELRSSRLELDQMVVHAYCSFRSQLRATETVGDASRAAAVRSIERLNVGSARSTRSNSRRLKTSKRICVAAVTVAFRTPPRIRAASPKKSPEL